MRTDGGLRWRLDAEPLLNTLPKQSLCEAARHIVWEACASIAQGLRGYEGPRANPERLKH